MAEAASGGMESAGVVLAAVDEFSANIQKYLADLRRVQQQNQQFTHGEEAAAAAALRGGQAMEISGQKAAKYALAAGVLSSQMSVLGVENRVAASAIGLAGDALSGTLGTIGAVIVAAGALVAAYRAITDHTKQMTAATAEAAGKLAAAAAQTGIQNEAQREALERRKAQIQTDMVAIKTKIEAARASEIELNLIEEAGLLYMRSSHAYEMANQKQKEWLAAKNTRVLTEETQKLQQLEAELKDIETAYKGGAKAISDQEQALAAAQQAREQHGARLHQLEIDHRTALRDRYAAEAQVYDLTLDGLARTGVALSAAAVQEKAIAHETAQARIDAVNLTVISEAEKSAEIVAIKQAEADRILAIDAELRRKLKALEDRVNAADDAAKRKLQAEREARFRRLAEVATNAAATIGQAMGAAAAGSTGAWRSAGIALIQIMAHAASQALLIWGAAMAGTGNIAGAMRAAAAAAVVEGLAGAAVGYLQERESRRNRNDDSQPEAVGGRSRGPTIDVGSSFSPRLSLVQHISGDVTPQAAAAWKQSAQEFLDGSMDKWLSRKRAQGYRFA